MTNNNIKLLIKNNIEILYIETYLKNSSFLPVNNSI